MRRLAVVVTATLLVTACGPGGDSAGGVAATTRDSAGVAIVEHPAGAWDAAPMWALSSAPIAVIGGDSGSAAIDLTNSSVGALLGDGRLLAATMQPPQLFVFGPQGERQRTLGRGGEGPGEYRLLSAILELGGDSVMAYDMMSRHGILFSATGDALGQVDFPVTGSPVPPQLTGRLDDGTFVFQVMNPLTEPPADAPEVYRLDQPVLTWREGMTGFDTLFMAPGQQSTRGSVEAAGQSIAISRAIAYGANSWVDAGPQLVWSSPGDRFVLQARDATGALKREVRVDRPLKPVSDEAKERFKTVAREQIERVRSMSMGQMPAGLLESELKKIDQTPFAEHYPAVGQMIVDRDGRIWATPDAPLLDSVLTWGVFSPDGALLGKVQLPKGLLFAASDDRVVVRQEDEETGLITLQIWGLQPTP